MKLRTMLGFIWLWLWFGGSAQLNAYEPGDYDPFLGGFVISPPAKFTMGNQTSVKMGVLVYRERPKPTEELVYHWQLDEAWATLTNSETKIVQIAPKRLGTFGITVEVRNAPGYSAFFVRRHFVITVIDAKSMPIPTAVVPESMYAYPGFPLVGQWQNAAETQWNSTLTLAPEANYTVFLGIQFQPKPTNTIVWDGNPRQKAATYRLNLRGVEAAYYWGGVQSVTTNAPTVTLRTDGVPTYAPDTQLQYEWLINGKTVTLTDEPFMQLATAGLPATNQYAVRLHFQRDGQSAVIPSAYANLTIKPPVSEPAPKLSITGWAKLQVPDGAQAQIKVHPFAVANQTVSDIGLQFGWQVVLADDTWQVVAPQALKQSPNLVLPQRLLPNGTYQSEIEVTYAQVPEIGS